MWYNTYMEKFIDKKIEDFVQELASKAPVPGGGGASALAGALGSALGGMVASLTLGKAKYADVEEEILSLQAALLELQEELLGLVEKDAEVFAPLADAYRMASVTEKDKADKEFVMQTCLQHAALVPLEIMEKCAESLPLIERLAEIGSTLAVSDAGCAAVLSKAAMQAAWLNVRINCRIIKDEKFAAKTDAKGRKLLEEGIPLADRIYSSVETKLL